MPKYVYKCKLCSEHFEVYHGMSEKQDSCVFCPGVDLHRVPQMPFLKPREVSKGDKIGDETKAAIEANRALLKESKRKASKEFYDDN
tara:strand:+ start:885 stop:1145 length:261 start_codon:yes stop_codon:yes gene_type:complete